MRTAPPVARVVASLGVQLAMVLLVAKRLGTKPLLIPKLFTSAKFRLGQTVVKEDRLWLAGTNGPPHIDPVCGSP